MSNASKVLLDKMLISKFLDEHQDYYDQWEKSYIRNMSSSLSSHEKWTKDVLREIYDQLEMIPDDKNMYITFMNLLENEFGIEGKNIIEVGGGIIPRLAERIHLKQKTGSITVYDPRLGSDLESKDRFVLKREDFSKKTNVDGADIIIGLMPCKGAESLIASATEHNIDFLVWLCEGGPHGDYFDFYESDEEWLSSMIYYAQRGVETHKMGKLKIKNMPEFSEYPIIYNRR